VRGKKTWKNDRFMANQIVAFSVDGVQNLGAKLMNTIGEDDVERFFAAIRQQGRAASTRNQYVQLWKGLCRWAVKKGHLERDPIIQSEVIRREPIARRSRRLLPNEEENLIKHASAHLQRLIIAALQTGCRRGELLNLQRRDVDLIQREIRIRAENSKPRKERILPVSQRLAGVLEMAVTNGRASAADAYVLGNELGGRIGNVKRAWETAVLKAHRWTPKWKKGSLTAESRRQLKDINLHFHDLRQRGGIAAA
jgi:integrase